MRIIGGNLKGRSIDFIKSNLTRPLKDSVRENIFNILEHSKEIDINIKKSKILDIYSGVGSFGLECISRGANFVTFVENSTDALAFLKKNLSILSISRQAEIISCNFTDLKITNKKNRYNIFFLDPPFKDKEYIFNLSKIKKEKIFTKKHIIIIHREKKSKDDFNNLINIRSLRNYGRSKIIFGTFN